MRLDKYFTLSLILVVGALCNAFSQHVNRTSGNDYVGSTNVFVFYTDNNPNFRFVRWDVYGNYTIEYSSGNVIRLHWNSTTAPSSVIAVYDNRSTGQYGLKAIYNIALTYPPPPAAPSALVATTVSYTQINLRWTDNSMTEASFRIERSLTSGSGFVQIATTAANATSYSDFGLAGSTKYYYRIRAVDAYNSRSAYSAGASATTRMTPPSAPSNLAATTVSSTQINLTWTDNATNESGFQIERSLTSGSGFTVLTTTGANVTSYSNSGLTAATKYYYRVRAINSGGNSYALEANATTLPNPPSAPTNLVATTASSTQINLTWTDNSSNESGFQIERSLTSGSGFTLVTTTSANITSYSNSGLAASTPYFYRVRAINTGGNSAYTLEANATTLPNPPSAPSNLVATTVSSTQINLTWIDNSSNETGFEIERSLTTESDFTLLTTTAPNVTSYANIGCTANTQYFYRVRAINSGGNSDYTPQASATTSPNLPSAPTNLVATAVSSTQIDLTWSDNASNETGFEIERSLTSGSGFTLLTTTAANVTSFANIGCTANTQYFYRVRAVNTGGNSDYTSQANATTLPNPPSAPTNLEATTVSSAQINLTWTDNVTNETGFMIERSLTSGSGFTRVFTTAANATSYSDTGLAGGTRYFYRLQATNTGGNSGYTSEASATTLQNPPAAPDQIAGLPVSSTTVIVTWLDKSNNETGFQIERAGGGKDYAGYSLIATTSANVTTFTDTGLTPGSLYYYRARAINSAGNSPYTIDVSALVFPPQPGQFTAQATSGSSITLNWTAPENSHTTEFQVERSTASGSGFVLISSPGGDARSFVDGGLSEGTTYFYRIRAKNNSGSSVYTPVMNAKTFYTPVAPTELIAQATSATSVTLNWADNSDNETGFHIERSVVAGSGFELISVAPANATSFVDGSLIDGTTYFYRVRSTNATGNSAYTVVASAKTELVSTVLADVLDDWAFQYRYDSRNRMIAKKVPGADWIYMIYNDIDQLKMTQDGNQRKDGKNEWTFTKYDELNRPVLTGIVDMGSTDLETLRYEVRNSTVYYETRGTSTHGYTNNSYPKVSDESKYLTVTYYDDYNFKSSFNSSEFDFKTNHLPSEALKQGQETVPNTSVKGQVTGTKVRMLTSGTWLKSVNYYDDKYRLIQVISENPKGFEVTTDVYDFVGTVLRTKTSLFTGQPVQWKNLVGAQAQGDVLQSTLSGSWASGASSVQTLPTNADGWVEITVIQKSPAFQFGFSDLDENTNSTTLDFALQSSNGVLRPYENGVAIGSDGIVQLGDVLRVERISGRIYYKRNGTVFHISEKSETTPVVSALIADVSFNGIGAKLAKGRVSNAFIVPAPGTPIPFVALQYFTKDFTYDDARRLKETRHKVSGGTEVIISKNEYNELGQLIDKKLHSTDGTTFKQSLDYRYNIRGWLTSINNAELTSTNNNNTNDDTNDLFGMNLAYNEDLKTGNASTDPAQDLRLYNGNISAIKWSNNQGIDAIKAFAYNFKYDQMNRLQNATHKQSSATDVWQSGQYDESGLVYDLNGNIKNLQRKGENGVVIDNLTYNYGAGPTLSNKLLYVTDNATNTVDRRKGFLDGNTSGNDYSYDDNGNMLIDKNKGITTNIIYNHLNLPDKITRNSGTLFYLYDATGKKHAQMATYSFNDKRHSEYVGPWVFENDELLFLQHEEGRVMLMQQELVTRNDGDDPATFIPTQSIAVTGQALNGEVYVRVSPVVGDILDKKGVMVGAPIDVAEGQKYKYIIKGYSNSSRYARLYVKGNTADLIWQGGALPVGVNNESSIEATFTIPAGVTQISLGVLFAGDVAATASDFAYINSVELHEIQSNSPEYQYDIKDHLGNVRVTFTTKESAQSFTATMEDASASKEQNTFLNYNETVKVSHPLFDKTNDNKTAASYNAIRLIGGNTNARYGLAKTLSVMPGDVVNMEVYAKYIDAISTNWTPALTNFMTSVANAASPSAAAIDGGAAGDAGISTFPFEGLLSKANDQGTGPKAYLNYLFFDRDYNYKDGGFVRLSSNAREAGNNVPHELLSKTFRAKEAGYVYVYLSNEGETPQEVYFDEFRVEQIESPVIQSQDYYPFGLTSNSYQRENSVDQKFKFQSQEHIDDLGLNWDSFKWRNHQPDIGRFFNVDPLADRYVYNSPYAFAENRVIDGRELEGLEWVNSTGHKVYDPKANDGKGGYTEHANINDRHFGGSLQGTVTGREQFSKLVNAKHPIQIKANFDSDIVYSDKAKTKVEYGKTDNERITEFDINTKQVEVTMESSTITINIETIDQAAQKGGTFGKMNITNMTFDEILGAVLGHEIEHTTPENNKVSATGRDAEAPAYKVSDKIINETWENIENEEKN